jgi:hypothetical protein
LTDGHGLIIGIPDLHHQGTFNDRSMFIARMGMKTTGSSRGNIYRKNEHLLAGHAGHILGHQWNRLDALPLLRGSEGYGQREYAGGQQEIRDGLFHRELLMAPTLARPEHFISHHSNKTGHLAGQCRLRLIPDVIVKRRADALNHRRARSVNCAAGLQSPYPAARPIEAFPIPRNKNARRFTGPLEQRIETTLRVASILMG